MSVVSVSLTVDNAGQGPTLPSFLWEVPTSLLRRDDAEGSHITPHGDDCLGAINMWGEVSMCDTLPTLIILHVDLR
jgi:hypothetical protein